MNGTGTLSLPTARRQRRGWWRTALAVVIVGVLLFPVYWMVNVSLQRTGGAAHAPWFPTSISFQGYATALVDQGGHLLLSLVVALGTVVVSLLVGAPGAYALSLLRAPGARGVLLVLLVAQMIPSIVVANALYNAYNELGMLNTVVGLILADATYGVPFVMLILTTGMQSVPDSIVEASRVDGAGRMRTFLAIVLPMSRNALVTGGLFSFLFAWGDFLFALTLTTSEHVRPVTLGIYTYLGAYVNDWSAVMATAVLASVPAVALLVVAQKYVAAGVSAGAVK